MRNPGFYAGTLRLEKPWYMRSVQHGTFPDKGPGEYWYDYKGFYFVGEKSGTGLLIPADFPRGSEHRVLARHYIFQDQDIEAVMEEGRRKVKLRLRDQRCGAGQTGAHHAWVGLKEKSAASVCALPACPSAQGLPVGPG